MSLNDTILDLETFADIPEELLEDLRSRVKADGRLKDPAKILADVAEKEQRLIDDAALRPLTGQIVMVGWATRDADEKHGWRVSQIPVFPGDFKAEKAAIEEVRDVIQGARVVTFNGRRFDLPFLAARAMIHGVEFPAGLPCGYQRHNHYDLMDVLQEGTLAQWNLRMFGEKKDQSDVAKLVRDAQWDQLMLRNRQDLIATGRLYDRMRKVVTL